MQSLTRPNGAVTIYGYDVLNRLTQMTTTVSGVVVNSYAYTYNGQDLRSGETAVEPAPPAPFAGELVNYTYNNVNALTLINDPGAKPLTHDASGNLTQGYTPEGYAFTAAYDGSNRVTSLIYTDGAGAVNRTEFSYLGKVVIKKVNKRNGVVTKESRYVNDGFQVMQERDGSNNVVHEYTWGLGLPGGIGGLLDLYKGAVHYSYLYDGKGNVTALLDPVGNTAASYQYDPFGVPRGITGSINQPFQFSTKPYDDKTGLSYYGYRFYVPTLGRWLTKDPLGEEGGINLYEFVNNNPVNWIDPDGRLAFGAVIPFIWPAVGPAAEAIAGAAIGIAIGLGIGNMGDNDHCMKALEKCLENPFQPKWNRKDFGPKKDCGACYRYCKREGHWPCDKCPQ